MIRRSVLVGALLVAPLAAQSGGGGDGPEPFEHLSLDFGRRAFEEGRHAEALGHFLYALAITPDPEEVLALLLQNARDDPDARALWAHAWRAQIVDLKGRARISPTAREWLPEDDPRVLSLALARARAAAEIAEARRKRRGSRRLGDAAVAEWLEDLGREVALTSEALRRGYGGLFDPDLEVPVAVHRRVIPALLKTARTALRQGDLDLAIRAARSVQGFAAQASFDQDWYPPGPDLSSDARAARQILGQARQRFQARDDEVVPLEELEMMSEEEARAFTLAHASFGNPGVTESPNRRYRVETNCGWQTLVGTARTVEHHHERLVRWYGKDPFLAQQGIVRVVPEAHGLEMEGAPFWWAGGFQGGPVTTVKMVIGTIPGLGRTLTHELTHRFDGAVYPGMPSWLVEGRAVWTGASYGSLHDTEFEENFVSWGSLVTARNKGYGGQGKLEQLLEGQVPDYRDNYPAGYALWTFLYTWRAEDGGPFLFRERLFRYLEELRDPPTDDRVGHFAYWFADGKEGRPEGMEAFASAFGSFLAGFDGLRPAEWVSRRYTTRHRTSDPAPPVYDEPTWTWLRNRAEPRFGQDEARVAGELLLEAGERKAAAEALLWSLAVDEPAPHVRSELAALLEDLHNRKAAWVLRHWKRLGPDLGDPEGSAAAPLLEELPRTRAFLEELAVTVEEYRGRGLETAALALAADHDRLAAILGAPLLARGGRPREDLLHPFDPPPQRLGAREGWVEEGLTGVEDRRVPGLWVDDGRGSLHVGRKTPRGATDTLDRGAPVRDAFCRSDWWQPPGRYRIEGLIEQTTSFLSGGVVFGYTGRDRNLRFGFRLGDWLYSIGEREEPEGIDSLGWSLDDLFPRTGNPRGTHRFEQPVHEFRFEILVDGPVAELWIEGERKAVVAQANGAPIQGYVGFYTTQGAMRVYGARVQRLDRSRRLEELRGEVPGYRLGRPGGVDWAEWRNRPVQEIPVGASGTLVFWIPDPLDAGASTEDRSTALQRLRRDLQTTLDRMAWYYEEDPVSQDLLVALPVSLREGMEELAEAFADHPLRPRFVVHAQTRDPSGEFRDPPPTVLFVDPVGILRWTGAFSPFHTKVPEELDRWIRMHRDHRRRGLAGAAE